MKFFLFSLGCKVNAYENDLLRETFEKNGDTETRQVEAADIIVLNTCSVTATADQKSRQHLRKFRRLSPHAVLVVMGCYSQGHAQEAASLGADIVLGTSHRGEVPTLVQRFLHDHQPLVILDRDTRHESYEEYGAFALTDHTRAYLKIQDGCNHFCSYCIIPFLRGNSRSRAKEDVLREAKRLVEEGCQEIVISGVEIGFYGLDLGDGSYRLGNLLRDILTDNPTLPRLRVSSLNPSEIDDAFLSVIRDFPAFALHLHLSLQSGSSSVLKRMKRPYDAALYRSTLAKIREIRPDIAITTDVIAGYPGETEEEWQETVRFVQDCQLAMLHVFPFSARKGTYAATLPDLDPKIKKRRVEELLGVSKQLQETYRSRFFGQTLPVLFEEDLPEKGYSLGHTSNFLLVKVPYTEPKKGKIIPISYSPAVVMEEN